MKKWLALITMWSISASISHSKECTVNYNISISATNTNSDTNMGWTWDSNRDVLTTLSIGWNRTAFIFSDDLSRFVIPEISSTSGLNVSFPVDVNTWYGEKQTGTTFYLINNGVFSSSAISWASVTDISGYKNGSVNCYTGTSDICFSSTSTVTRDNVLFLKKLKWSGLGSYVSTFTTSNMNICNQANKGNIPISASTNITTNATVRNAITAASPFRSSINMITASINGVIPVSTPLSISTLPSIDFGKVNIGNRERKPLQINIDGLQSGLNYNVKYSFPDIPNDVDVWVEDISSRRIQEESVNNNGDFIRYINIISHGFTGSMLSSMNLVIEVV